MDKTKEIMRLIRKLDKLTKPWTRVKNRIETPYPIEMLDQIKVISEEIKSLVGKNV